MFSTYMQQQTLNREEFVPEVSIHHCRKMLSGRAGIGLTRDVIRMGGAKTRVLLGTPHKLVLMRR